MPVRALALLAVTLLASCAGGPPGSPSLESQGSIATANASTGAAATVPTPTDEPTEKPGPPPVDVVQTFYDWYLEGQSMDAVMSRPELSEVMVEFLAQFEGPADPFTCSAEVPDSVRAVTSSLSGATAIVSTVVSPDGTTEQPGPPIDLILSEGGEWQLEFVGCPE